VTLRTALEELIETVAAGQFDIPRRRVADELRAILAANPDEHPGATGPAAQGGPEYAILSFRDGLEPVDSLEEAKDQMRMFWQKPGRARIMHRHVAATGWEPLEPDADGPALEAA
jgi:hypothetical protein